MKRTKQMTDEIKKGYNWNKTV